MIEQKIKQSIVLDRTIPDYVREEFPKFVEFVRAYYRYLESDGNTVDQLNKLLANKDIFTVSSDEHKFFILNTFMDSIPKNLELEYKTLLLNVRNFYSVRGTEDSIKTFFYLLSESKKPYRVVVKWDGDEDFLVGEEIFGSNSGSRATVIRTNRLSQSSKYVVLTLQYTTEPEYSKRFFTSSDEIRLSDGTVLDIEVEDFQVQLFYPRNYLLRSSDGVYEREYRCRFRLPEGRYRSFVNKEFVTSSGSVGRVDKQSYSLKTHDGYDHYEMTLSFSVMRGWTHSEAMLIDGEQIDLVPVVTDVTIETPGQGYVVGQSFRVLSTSGEHVATLVADEVCVCRVTALEVQNGGSGYSYGDKFRFRYSDGLFGSGYVDSVSAGTISTLHIENTRKGSWEIPNIEFLNGNNSARIYPLSKKLSGIERIRIEDVGFNVPSDAVVEVLDQPYPYDKASLQVHTGFLYRTNPSFKDDRGELSSYYRLQDNYYWQDFSYDIRFNKPTRVEDTDELFKKTVHPAGFKYFYTYRRSEETIDGDNSIKDVSTEKVIKIHDRMGNVVIRDFAYDEIGSIPRIKDTNPFYTYVHPLNVRESLKKYVIDNYMYFPNGTMTIDELSDGHSLHKYTTGTEFISYLNYETVHTERFELYSNIDFSMFFVESKTDFKNFVFDSYMKFVDENTVSQMETLEPLKKWSNIVSVVGFETKIHIDYDNIGLMHLGGGPVISMFGENIMFMDDDGILSISLNGDEPLLLTNSNTNEELNLTGTT